ncbi:MAG TPA: hypothetical protein VF597_00725 [Candidatus Saccharimonadales bacterium]|jgi:hypothetical protein
MSGRPTFQFDPSIFTTPGDGIVTLGSPGVWASNIEVDGFPCYDPELDYTFPVAFEVTGLYYHYVVNVWTDKAEIEVRDPATLERRSTIVPRNQSELLEAIYSIGADFEELHDAFGGDEQIYRYYVMGVGMYQSPLTNVLV